MARQRGTSGRRVGSSGGSGAVGVTSRGEPGAEAEAEAEAEAVPLTLTCYVWQASNTDGYFAVTGHWIEEVASGEWDEEEALFGFTQLNTAHNRTRLGQALYKVCNRLNIVHKVHYSHFHGFY